jgi:hypothetical protein
MRAEPGGSGLTEVPRPAIVWGILGLIPFVYGAAMILAGPATLPTFGLVEEGPRGGAQILERFGAAILAFMGGCLWGFSSAGRLPTYLLLGGAAIPAFIAFVAIQPNPALSCLWLAFGYVVLQGLDVLYSRAGVVPQYWLSLRMPLTAAVMGCLLVGALYG